MKIKRNLFCTGNGQERNCVRGQKSFELIYYKECSQVIALKYAFQQPETENFSISLTVNE